MTTLRNILTITYLTTTILCSCGQHNDRTKTTLDNISDNSATTKETKNEKIVDWEPYQDSLRTEILKSKDNEILKNSFLQEMYIRNAFTILNDTLFFKIDFNLHGADCGAPDCYSTDISFSFKLGDTLIFPKNLKFDEHEHGCIDKEKHLTGRFDLIEQTDKYVLYHSIKQKRTLVLFSSNEDIGTTAFYFTDVDQNKINGTNLFTVSDITSENYDESDYPFTSWTLSTNEYENFIH